MYKDERCIEFTELYQCRDCEVFTVEVKQQTYSTSICMSQQYPTNAVPNQIKNCIVKINRNIYNPKSDFNQIKRIARQPNQVRESLEKVLGCICIDFTNDISFNNFRFTSYIFLPLGTEFFMLSVIKILYLFYHLLHRLYIHPTYQEIHQT